MGRINGYITICCCCLIWSGWSARLPAQISAQAAVYPSTVETGDTFQLRVLVSGTASQPAEVDFTAWEPWLPVDNRLQDYRWQRSGTQWVRRFTLIALDSMTAYLPPLSIRLSAGDSLLTNPVQLTVRPMPAGTELPDLSGIRDIRREPVHWTDYWPLAAALLILAGALWWYLRRKKPAPVAIPLSPPPPMPAHEKALAALDLLEQKQLLKKGQVSVYYESLDLITRRYLEERFSILATESTTREVLRDLKNSDFPSASLERLQLLLQEADLVKYARIIPSQHKREQSLNTVRQIILSATPQAQTTTS
jgi:hypothetical protein